jgi:hypothetical protein
VIAVAAGVSACSATKPVKVEDKNICPFLGAEVCAKLVASTAQPNLHYVNPDAHWTQYNAVVIAPVTFWGGADTTVPTTDQQALTNYFYQAIRTQMAKTYSVVEQPGPGVMQIQVAIDDVQSATPVLRTISLVVPQARPLDALKYLATGTYPFAGSAQVEGKVTDSMSGQVLAAGVYRRIGGSAVTAADQWKWGDVENAMSTWAQQLAERLHGWTSGATPPS